MYPIVLAIHNVVRWVVLIAGVYALIRSYQGWFGRGGWSEAERRSGVIFSSALDLQLLLGLILYFLLSPITRRGLQELGAAMADPGLRFFVLEHALYMLLAVISAHLGVALAKRAVEPIVKHRRIALWFTLTWIFLLLGMPWARPLLPGLG